MNRFCLIVLLSASLAACGTTGPAPTAPAASAPVVVNKLAVRQTAAPTEVPAEADAVDQNCMAIARFARTVATIRDQGLRPAQVWNLVAAPTTFPAAPVVREVFSRRDVSPEIGEINSYSVCKKVTYQVMLSNLVKVEADYQAAEAQQEAQRLAAEEAAAKAARKKQPPKAQEKK